MGGEQNGVEPVLRGSRRMHIDAYIRSAGGEIDHADSAVLVHDPRQSVIGRFKARHIGASGKRPHLDLPLAVPVEQPLQVLRVNAPVGPWGNADHFADRFPPGNMVGVVLHMRDEDDRAVPLGHRGQGRRPPAPRHFQSQQTLQLVHRAGHPGPGKQEHIVRSGVDVALDDALRLLVSGGHRRAGQIGMRMRISRERAQLLGQFRFDRPVQTAAGRPIGVEQPLPSVRRNKALAITDRIFPIKMELIFLRDVAPPVQPVFVRGGTDFGLQHAVSPL